MKLRKFASCALAGALALSLSVPAFAAEATGPSVTFDGSISVPTINVSLPSKLSVVLNPYRMKVEVSKGVTAQDQVVSATTYAKNLSDVDVQVTLKAKATAADGITLETTCVDPEVNTSVTTKSVFMYLEAQIVDTDASEPTWTITDLDDATDDNGVVVLSATEKTMTGFEAIAAATTTRVASTGYVVNVLNAAVSSKQAAEAHGYLAMKVSGDANPYPTTAWADTDTVSVSIAFTFTPLMMEIPAATEG